MTWDLNSRTFLAKAPCGMQARAHKHERERPPPMNYELALWPCRLFSLFGLGHVQMVRQWANSQIHNGNCEDCPVALQFVKRFDPEPLRKFTFTTQFIL